MAELETMRGVLVAKDAEIATLAAQVLYFWVTVHVVADIGIIIVGGRVAAQSDGERRPARACEHAGGERFGVARTIGGGDNFHVEHAATAHGPAVERAELVAAGRESFIAWETTFEYRLNS